jgi:tellurite resistance protein TehA-like permease
MNADRAVVRAYGALVALYPRTFRDEYGADMVQLVRDTCDDEPAWRVASRVVVDLALSIPTQHLERHMKRNPSPLIPLIYTAVAGAGVLLALAGGTSIALLVVGLAVALLAGTVAMIAWRRVGPVGGSVQTQHWWKLVLAGPVLIGGVIVAAQAGVEAWFAGLLTVFLGLILTGTGLLLGLTRLTTRRPPVIPT